MNRKLIAAGMVVVLSMTGCSGAGDYQPEQEQKGGEGSASEDGSLEKSAESVSNKADEVLVLQNVLKEINVALGGDLGEIQFGEDGPSGGDDSPPGKKILQRARDLRKEKIRLKSALTI